MKKRLNGINEIKSIIESTSDSVRKSHWQDEDSPRRSRWLKPEYLCKWINDNKLVEYLLGDSSHVEVIKRSTTVLRFLSHNQQLTKGHLDLLWGALEDKHEATVLGVFETINEIVDDLNTKQIDYLFTKIQSIPIKKYNEQTVKFVKEFTIKAFKVCKSANQKELIDVDSDNEEEGKTNQFYLDNAKGILDGTVEEPPFDIPQYGLPILFEILHQGNELGSQTRQAFIEMLKMRFSDSFRVSYILKCIKNLQNGVAVYQSLSIISSIFQKTFSARAYNGVPTTGEAVTSLNRDFDLIDVTIKNIERYNTVVQKSMVDSVNKGIVPENISKTCFEGTVTHSDYLEKLFEFIEFVIIYSGNEINLGTENIEKLWNIFVSTSSIEFDKNLFFKWLTKEKFNKPVAMNPVSRSIFTTEERHFLFTDILCKNDYVNKHEITFNCFK